MSEAQKNRDWSKFVPPNKGKVWATNGEINIYVSKNSDLPEGFVFGCSKKKDTSYYSNSWTKERREKQSIRCSGSGNNMYGKGYKLSGGKNGHATKTYYYLDKVFDCRKYLVKFLQENIDDKITVGIIRSIELGKKRTISKYPVIYKNLRWELKNENNKH